MRRNLRNGLRSSRRSAFGLTGLAVAAVAGAMVVSPGAGAGAAAPSGDCTAPYPEADVTVGQEVRGLTVSQGTTPTEFDGKVLGVLKNGIGPGLDMIMMRLDSTEIDRVGGVWAGMSGSPVYDQTDGRLIGAVAYGLTYGSSPVAGITPYEDMDDYARAAAGKVAVTHKAARQIAARTDVTVSEASQGFTQIRIPLGVAGVNADRLATVRKKNKYLDKDATVMGTASATEAGPDSIVAGGAVSYSAAYGDVDIAATGTVTSMCGGKVVAFGHPATFGGKVTAGMHPADVLYIQEDTLGSPFMVPNIGDIAGTFTDDHQTGITGDLGTLPTSFPVTSTVHYGSREADGTSNVVMKDYLPNTVYYQVIGTHDQAVDAHMPGSEVQSWTITGTKPDGKPYTLGLTNRITSSYDVSDEASYSLADISYILSQLPGVSVSGVTVEGTVSDDASTYSITSVQQKQPGGWGTVRKGGLVLAKAGKTLKLRVIVSSEAGGTKTLPVNVAIPKKLSGAVGGLAVVGGGYMEPSYWDANTFAKFAKAVHNTVRTDQVAAVLEVGRRKNVVSQTSTSSATDKEVLGHRFFEVLVQK